MESIITSNFFNDKIDYAETNIYYYKYPGNNILSEIYFNLWYINKHLSIRTKKTKTLFKTLESFTCLKNKTNFKYFNFILIKSKIFLKAYIFNI